MSSSFVSSFSHRRRSWIVIRLQIPANMKFLLSFCVIALIAAATCEEPTLEELDLENLLSDETKRTAAFDCLMDKAPCGQMQGLRDTLPQMIETKCSQCTPKQKEKYEQANKILFTKYPKEFQDLALKYSPKSN